MGVSVVNSCILYNATKPDILLNTHDFFDDVINALVDLDKTYNWDVLNEGDVEDDDVPPLALAVPVDQDDSGAAVDLESEDEESNRKVIKRCRMKFCEKTIDRLEGIHIPTLLANDKRRKCVFHSKIKSRYLCQTCDVALCLSDNPKESCWFKFHHVETWKEK